MIQSLIAFVTGLFAVPTGFGTAGMRRHRIAGEILIVGSWAGQRGVELDETGISVRAFDCIYRPFVNDRLMSNVGEPRARAVSGGFSREVTVQGEATGATGLMAATLGVPIVVANDIKTFHPTSYATGTTPPDALLLLDEVTESQERAGWRSINMRLSSDPGISSVS
jgi:hypothetical protein